MIETCFVLLFFFVFYKLFKSFQRGETVTLRENIIELVEAGYSVEKKKTHFYRSGNEKYPEYTILHFDHQSNVIIPEERYKEVGEAVDKFVEATTIES